MFAQATHVVAVPHRFASVIKPATKLYILCFINIHSGVSGQRGRSKFNHYHWLLACTTSWTATQAVTNIVAVWPQAQFVTSHSRSAVTSRSSNQSSAITELCAWYAAISKITSAVCHPRNAWYTTQVMIPITKAQLQWQQKNSKLTLVTTIVSIIKLTKICSHDVPAKI